MDDVVETVAVCNEAAGAPKEHAKAQTADRCMESTAFR